MNHPTHRLLRKTCDLLLGLATLFSAEAQTYLSPTQLEKSADGSRLYVLLSTARRVVEVFPDKKESKPVVDFPGEVSSFALSPDGSVLYAARFAPQGVVTLHRLPGGKSLKQIPVGAYPSALCLDRSGRKLYVANRFEHTLSVIDLQRNREVNRLPMEREPCSLALSPDGSLVAVGNLLPRGGSIAPIVSAHVSWVDTQTDRVVGSLPLTNGSHSIGDVCFSADGSWLFVTHIVSRFQYPTTQVERGWINTNAVSVIDVRRGQMLATLLLDDVIRGAANPCGMALSPDGNTLFTALSGTHEVMAVQINLAMKSLKKSPSVSAANDLSLLTPYKRRIMLSGQGPRQLLVADGRLWASNYFTGNLSSIDLDAMHETGTVPLGVDPPMDARRRGELYFADARLCHQQWQSCISCHPGARADGLNWDLVNDGVGNPKNTKSMLYAHATPPSMISGIRANAETAVRSGIKYIQFTLHDEEKAQSIDSFLISLRPLTSPYLKKGKLSKKALRGKNLFQQSGCADCHNGPYLTDGQRYNVGSGEEEYESFAFDTPTLREVWRTAPYLYNGKAQTIGDVLTRYNTDDKHGVTSTLTPEEIEALEEYILTL